MLSRQAQFGQLSDFNADALLAAAALREVAAYNGSEAAYDKLTGALIEIEKTFAADPVKLPADKERTFFETTINRTPSFNDLLGEAHDNFIKSLRRKDALADITVTDAGGAFLPPEPQPLPMRGENPQPFKAPEFDNRLADIIGLIVGQTFRGVTIYREDLFIIPGTVTKEQMRAAPYDIITIPALQCQIAVCNQIGEASFFVPKILTKLEWQSYGKQYLQDNFGAVPILRKEDLRKQLWHVLNTGEKQTAKPTAQEIEQQKAKAVKRILTENLIWFHCLAYAKLHSSWPSQNSGKVEDLQNEKWQNWQQFLNKGGRGLPGGLSITQLFDNKVREEWAKFEAINKRQPITSDQFSNTHFIWDDIEKLFFNNNKRARTLQQVIFKDEILNKELIWQKSLDFLQDSDPEKRRWPTLSVGKVKGFKNENWNNWNLQLSRGGRGLGEKSSVSALIEEKVREAWHSFVAEHKREPQDVDYFDTEKLYWKDIRQAFLNSTSNSARKTLHDVIHGQNDLSQTLIFHYALLELADCKPPIKEKWPTGREGFSKHLPDLTWRIIAMAAAKGKRGLSKTTIATIIKDGIRKEWKQFKKLHGCAPGDSDLVGNSAATWGQARKAFLSAAPHNAAIEEIVGELEPLSMQIALRLAFERLVEKGSFPVENREQVKTYPHKTWKDVCGMFNKGGKFSSGEKTTLVKQIKLKLTHEYESYKASNNDQIPENNCCLSEFPQISWGMIRNFYAHKAVDEIAEFLKSDALFVERRQNLKLKNPEI